MRCEECGNHDVRRREIAGRAVLECGLCGHLDGQDEDILAIQEAQAAAASGIDGEVYGLVCTLQKAPGLKVVTSGGGDEERGIAPYVRFSIPGGSLLPLERLHTTLRMCGERTQLPWLVKVAMDRHLAFVLSPATAASPGRRPASEVRKAQADLQVLAAALERDLELAFWKERQ